MTRFLLGLAAGSVLGLALPELADPKFSPVDLQPQANQKLTDNFGTGREGNNLASLPKAFSTCCFASGELRGANGSFGSTFIRGGCIASCRSSLTAAA